MLTNFLQDLLLNKSNIKNNHGSNSKQQYSISLVVESDNAVAHECSMSTQSNAIFRGTNNIDQTTGGGQITLRQQRKPGLSRTKAKPKSGIKRTTQKYSTSSSQSSSSSLSSRWESCESPSYLLADDCNGNNDKINILSKTSRKMNDCLVSDVDTTTRNKENGRVSIVNLPGKQHKHYTPAPVSFFLPPQLPTRQQSVELDDIVKDESTVLSLLDLHDASESAPQLTAAPPKPTLTSFPEFLEQMSQSDNSASSFDTWLKQGNYDETKK